MALNHAAEADGSRLGGDITAARETLGGELRTAAPAVIEERAVSGSSHSPGGGERLAFRLAGNY